MSTTRKISSVYWLLLVAALLTTAIYWPGLYGGWLFDDYPNIVDNAGVQPHHASIPTLVRAAMSSPASDFKRPLSSLSFAANYLASGLDPFGWKLTNLVIHLLNGMLVFLLARALLRWCTGPYRGASEGKTASTAKDKAGAAIVPAGSSLVDSSLMDRVAAWIAAGWMLLPINLTAVLYVVQREESLANVFVLLGLIGYMVGRRRMLAAGNESMPWRGLALCAISVTVPTAIGMYVKETAVMLPLYALLIEWIVFRFVRPGTASTRKDWRISALFTITLLLPMVVGTAWLLPSVLSPNSWATRDFTLSTRLLSEARIVCDYIVWTLLPTPGALSFYHDQFQASTGLLSPWTTLASMLVLATLVALMFRLRQRQPLVALGIGLFLGCHLLTGTILPLELVYEHRNYFASFGVLLAVVPFLAAIPSSRTHFGLPLRNPPLTLLRRALLPCLLVWWAGLTAITASAWGDPLRLAQELAARAPDSPRAQYELGRTYIIYSHYDPLSPYTRLAYAPLERAAAIPQSSILPQQALIFMNARMGLPQKAQWWESMIAKLGARPPGVQDESSLAALVECSRDGACPLPTDRMVQAFNAALAHPTPRLQATYSDYAWNVLGNHALGLRMIEAAVQGAPREPAYQITMIRMLAAQGQRQQAVEALDRLRLLNIGGRLDGQLDELSNRLGLH